MLLIYFAIRLTPIVITYISFKRPKRIILISFQNLELLLGRSSSPVGYGIGIAEVVGSNPTRSTFIPLYKYGIVLSSFLVSVGQIQQQLKKYSNKFLDVRGHYFW